MWFYVQTWLPILTVALTAAICFSVVSFIMGQPASAVMRSAHRPHAGQPLRRHARSPLTLALKCPDIL
jgi:hypothetical protein